MQRNDPHLYIFSLTREELRTFRSPVAPLSRLRWSPLGEQLICQDTEDNVYVVREKTMIGYWIWNGQFPVWSPNGQMLNTGTVMLDVYGNVRRKNVCAYGDWSCNHQFVFPDTDMRIKVADWDGSNAFFVDEPLARAGIRYPWVWGDGPVWSLDGKQIAFYQYANTSRIFVMDLNGTPPIYIGDGVNPQWSYDGGRVLFCDPDNTSIFFAYNDGDFLEQVAAGKDPSWSPHGHMISYCQDEGVFLIRV